MAFGAAMAGWADVIPGFENWPHPYGVVRSHDTLAALMYYAAFVEEQKKQLPESAPGLLLLDNQRLAPYTDADDKFDNRYMATVPSARPCSSVVSKTSCTSCPAVSRRKKATISMTTSWRTRTPSSRWYFPLSDFQKVAQQSPSKSRMAPRAPSRKRAITTAGARIASRFSAPVFVSGAAAHAAYPPHGISVSAELPIISPPGGGGGWRSTTLGDVRAPSTPPPSYEPRSRPTLFSGTRVGGQAGVGRTKPSGFGRTTFRTSGGQVTSVGRSGSLGRGGSGSS